MDALELLKLLNETYPVFRENKPLAMRIHKVIAVQMPELDRNVLSEALKLHVRTPEYLEALRTGEVRFKLDGTEWKKIIPAHRKVRE
jgi:ProP effector